jgi:rRNA-processing protein FCF1
MTDPLLDLIRAYHSRGVLVDTDILLLYFVGKFAPEHIPRFKRTRQFDVEDYDLLVRLLARFKRIVTTPNVLSEVSSLSGQLGEPLRSQYYRDFAGGITTLDEHYVASTAAAQRGEFSRLGLTDCAIAHLATGKYLVLTDDSALFQFLEKAGVDVLNFNHLRSAPWIS